MGCRRLIVQSDEGVCNRMRVLLSGWALAEATNRSFEMIWKPGILCGCKFNDLFVNNLNIYDNPDEIALAPINFDIYKGKVYSKFDICKVRKQKLFVQTDCWLTLPKQYKGHRLIHSRAIRLFEDLQPSTYIRDKVEEFAAKNFINSMIGVHIRRGDFKELRYFFQRRRNFVFILRQMDRLLKERVGCKFFVATDDGAPNPWTGKVRYEGIKEKLGKRYGDKVVFFNPRSFDRSHIEAVQDSLIELLLMRKTNIIIGTYWSSFTDFAALGRNIPKITRKS